MATMSNILKYHALNKAIASGDTIKLAFYNGSAAIDATTVTYSATNEVTQAGATPAIPAGGVTLTGRSLSASDGSASTASVDWDNLTITPNAQFQFQKVLIWNSTQNHAIGFHDYLTTQTWNASTAYTLNLPDSGTGVVRFA